MKQSSCQILLIAIILTTMVSATFESNDNESGLVARVSRLSTLLKTKEDGAIHPLFIDIS